MELFERFYISQVGILIRNNKCLILEFTKLPGEWGLPGGRIDKMENAEEAFKREIKEEINFDNFEIKGFIDYDIFYTRSNKPYCAIIQYITNEESEITLSHEHSRYKWIGEDEIENFSFVWPKLPETIKKGFKYHKLNKL